MRLGLTPITGLLVWTEYYDEPGYDANIHAKYVVPLGGGNFVNVEGGYADADVDNELYAAADFYFDPTFSVGARYDDEGDIDAFTLRTRKFFTTTISGQFMYTKYDDIDAIRVESSFRF